MSSDQYLYGNSWEMVVKAHSKMVVAAPAEYRVNGISKCSYSQITANMEAIHGLRGLSLK